MPVVTGARFTEAVVALRDGSVLYFCHRVGEPWAKAVGPEGNEGGCSQELLGAIRMFRLNAKHLEILLNDGSAGSGDQSRSDRQSAVPR